MSSKCQNFKVSVPLLLPILSAQTPNMISPFLARAVWPATLSLGL